MAASGIRRDAAALAIACGRAVKAAAQEVQIGERTLHRWLKEDPAFMRRVNEYRDELFSRTVGRLSELSGKATETLEKLLNSDSEKVQIQAVRLTYESLAAGRQAMEFAARVKALEEAHEQGVPDETTASELGAPPGADGESGDSGPGATGERATAAAAG